MDNRFNPSILHIYVFICKWRDILWQLILSVVKPGLQKSAGTMMTVNVIEVQQKS